ncbi:MAG: AI-2E family transporter [Gammaproteobacteria bacterium]|nr:AI-2E family transporter [Gammaproteobacteria bacterium]
MGSTSRTLVVFAALIVIVAGLKAAEDLVVPFLLAAFIATIAATPVFWLEKHRVPVAISIFAVMVTMVVVLIGIGALVAQSASDFTDRLPFYRDNLTAQVNDIIAWLGQFGIEISSEVIANYFDPAKALELAGTTLRGFGAALGNSFLILLTVIFILAEASSFPRKLRDVLNNPDRNLPYFSRFAENVNRYIAIKTTVSVATGFIIGIYLTILDVDFPVLWGLLAFLLNYVPTIGSIIAAVPAVLLALVQLGTGSALLTAGGYVVVNIVMGNAVEPRFMGKGLGLSTLVVFLSLVVWGWMLGPVGMLLSVPLTMTAKIAMEANPSTIWLAHLLGPADALPNPTDSIGGGQAPAADPDDEPVAPAK